jgi:hypothetical protein
MQSGNGPAGRWTGVKNHLVISISYIDRSTRKYQCLMERHENNIA